MEKIEKDEGNGRGWRKFLVFPRSMYISRGRSFQSFSFPYHAQKKLQAIHHSKPLAKEGSSLPPFHTPYGKKLQANHHSKPHAKEAEGSSLFFIPHLMGKKL